MWFDPGLARLFITSTLLHLGEDINLLVVSATHLTISHQINSSKFCPIKGGICHAFRYLSVQIKIMLLLSFFVFCNVQVLFYVILISYLCFSFHFLYLYNYVLILFIYVSFFHYV